MEMANKIKIMDGIRNLEKNGANKNKGLYRAGK